MARRFILLIIWLSLGGLGWSDLIQDPLHQSTREGRSLYDAKQPNQAMAAFGRGRATDPDHPVLAFDVGVSLLAMDKPDQAIEELRKALRTDDPKLKARTFYNLGNAYLQKNELPKAVESFRESLLLQSDQKDAKRNLELALRRQRQQEQDQRQSKDNQDQKQQDKQQDKQQGQNKPDSPQKQDQGQQNPGQPQNQDKQEPQAKGGQDQKKGQPQSQPGQPDKDKSAQGQQRPAREGKEDKDGKGAKKMDPAQAMQLLQALQNQEKAQLMQLLQSQKKTRKKEGRDW